MKQLLIATSVAAMLVCLGAEQPVVAPATKPLSEVQVLRLENLALRERLVQQALDQVRKDGAAAAAAICGEAHIPVDVCQIDMDRKTVSRKAPESTKDELKK